MSTRYGGRDDFRDFGREDDEDRYGRDYETGGRSYGRSYSGESSRRLGYGRDTDDYDTGRGYGGGYTSRGTGRDYERGGYDRGEIGGNVGGYGRDRSRGYGSNYYGGSSARGYDRDDDYTGRGSDYTGRGSDYGRYSGGYGSRPDDSERRPDYGRGFGGYFESGRGGGRGDYDNDRYNVTGGGYASRGTGGDYERGGYGRGDYDRGGSGRTDYGRGYSGRDYDRGRTGREYDRGDYRGRERDRDDDDRGWLNRAADEVRSWFGDEEAERRRRSDETHNAAGTDYFGGSHRGRGPKNYRRSDERIREDVSDRLSDNDWLDASDIDVDVDGGNVTLTGVVDSRHAKRLAEDIAESCSGVTNVQNNLRVRGRHGAGSGDDAASTNVTSLGQGSAGDLGGLDSTAGTLDTGGAVGTIGSSGSGGAAGPAGSSGSGGTGTSSRAAKSSS